MKIKCACGHTISDQTDYLTHKARFVADQDYFDLCDAIESQVEALAADTVRSPSDKLATEAAVQKAVTNTTKAISKYLGRALYQCPDCGRLMVNDARFNIQVFVPRDELVPRNLTRSVEGDQWKRPLRGHWNDRQDGGSGDVWWGSGDVNDGYERHDDWEELKRRYFEIFAELQAKDILRDAFLRKGDEYLHKWP